MADLPVRRWLLRAGWPTLPVQVALALGSLAGGILLAYLPLMWAATALLLVVLILWTLADPLIGLCAALILGPTKPLTDYYFPELPLDLGQMALIVTLGVWALHMARRRVIHLPRSPLNGLLLTFIGVAALSLLNALSLGYGLRELLKWVQMLLVMWLIVAQSKGRGGRWPIVLGALLLAGATEAGIGIWQSMLRGEGPKHFLISEVGFYRAYGTFEQPNPYGGYIGLLLPLAVGLALMALERWFAPLWAVIKERHLMWVRQVTKAVFTVHLAPLATLTVLGLWLLAALLLSWSRGAWLGFGAAMLAMLFVWPRRIGVGVALAFGSAAVGSLMLQFNLLPAGLAARLTEFLGSFQSFDVRGVNISPFNYALVERLAHWQAAQEMARHHFWLGVGIGNYEPVYPAYALINWPLPLGHAHNIYLNILAETGIIGLLAYVALWLGVLWHTWRVTHVATGWERGVAIGLFGAWVHLSVHQVVDNLYVANIHLAIGALLGMLGILILRGETKQRESDHQQGHS